MISLSFDTDHMSEERMAEFLSAVELPGGVTFFCTQPYACLDRKSFELAPHPYLGQGRAWLEELKTKRAEFPDAVGWRAHSCVFSHTLAEWLRWNGYAYASTHDNFGCAGLRPNRHMWGIWHVPIYYMDNLDFSRRRFSPERGETPFAAELIAQAVAADGFHVFDFHPIHLLLNSPDPDWYMSVRDRFLAGQPVSGLRHDGYGARSFFDDLLAAMLAGEMTSVKIIDGLREYTGELPLVPAADPGYRFDERRLGFN
jgi:Polysaccharide deacetylase